MRYTFTTKPPKVAAAASRDTSRPALTCAYYDPAAGELRATDSYIAVRMPVSPDPGDTEGWVSAGTLERSRKRDAGAISCNGAAAVYTCTTGDPMPEPETVARLTVATFPRPEVGQPPNLPQLWPVARDGFTVGINAAFLKRLADALGADDSVVRLTFASDDAGQPSPLRPILVRPKGAALERTDGCSGLSAPEGLVMPVRCS